MLWFNFILGSNFISLCFKLLIIHYHTQKQREIKFKPRIKWNHNINNYGEEKLVRKSLCEIEESWPMFIHYTWGYTSRSQLFVRDKSRNIIIANV